MEWKAIERERENWLFGWTGFERGNWRVVMMNFRTAQPRCWHIVFNKAGRGWGISWGFNKRFSSAENAMAAIEKQLKRTPEAA